MIRNPSTLFLRVRSKLLLAFLALSGVFASHFSAYASAYESVRDFYEQTAEAFLRNKMEEHPDLVSEQTCREKIGAFAICRSDKGVKFKGSESSIYLSRFAQGRALKVARSRLRSTEKGWQGLENP